MAKNKNKKAKGVQNLSPKNYIRQRARNLPIHECWVNTDWEMDGIANITIARKHSNGNFTIGMYLIDLKCLGVKNAHYYFNISPFEYQEILELAHQNLDLEKIGYELAHNIIYSGLAYAEDYGFKPHKDFEIAKYIVEEDTEAIKFIEIECGGEDGKPLYIRSPFDSDVQFAQIFAQLEKTAGPGHYHIIQEDLFTDSEEDEPWGDPIDEDLWSEDKPEKDNIMYYDKSEIQNSMTFQFKIKIHGISKPPVWRTILVPSYYTFYNFHYVIQEAFGWTNSHLFQFSEKGYRDHTVITHVFNDTDNGDYDQIDADDIKLEEIFKTNKQKFKYIYDFGDSWEHHISLEKIIPEISKYPECLGGKGQCPPEDCGGCWGYENLKEILKDKSHPEYEEYTEWLCLEEGETWDPEFFDKDETNLKLQVLFTQN